MTRAQAVLDWIGHWLDGEVSPRYEIQTQAEPIRTLRRFT